MNTKARHIAFLGLILAFSVATGYFERMIPTAVPALPGIKLGLPNIAVVVVMYLKDHRTAFALNILRVILSGMLFSGVWGMVYGLCGAAMSFAAMAALKKTGAFGTVGVSAAGGVCHNFGQICMGALFIQSAGLFCYFPVLIVFGTASGIITGYLAGILINRLKV